MKITVAICSSHDFLLLHAGESVSPRVALALADEGATPADIVARATARGRSPRPDYVPHVPAYVPHVRQRPARAARGTGELDLVPDVEAEAAGMRRMARGERAGAARHARLAQAIDFLLGQGYVALPLHAVATAERWTAEEWALIPDVSMELATVFASDRPADGIAFRTVADALLLPRDRKRKSKTTANGQTYATAGPDWEEAIGDAVTLLWQRSMEGKDCSRPFALVRSMMRRLVHHEGRAARHRVSDGIDAAAAAEWAVELADPLTVVRYLQGSGATAAATAVAKRLDRRATRGGENLSDTERSALARAEAAIRRFIARHHEG